MLLQPLHTIEGAPRYLLNGFPKAGMHLLALMLSPVCSPPEQADMPWERPDWWGVLHNIWTTQWRDDDRMRQQFWKLARLQPQQYIRAHVPYREDVAAHIDNCGISHVFVYRDPRDVAVSLAHHVINPDAVNFRHSAKRLFMLMDSFDDVLMATIRGIGPLAGVMERWAMYAPWLEQPRTLSVRYEGALINREETAKEILLYGLNRIQEVFEPIWKIDAEAFTRGVKLMAEASYDTDKSPTFRKGASGGWRDAFTADHIAAFKETDTDGWLVELGYEDEEDW